jgi:hypothetical protein
MQVEWQTVLQVIGGAAALLGLVAALAQIIGFG